MNDTIKQPLIDRIRGILQAEGLTAAGSQDLAQAIVTAAEEIADAKVERYDIKAAEAVDRFAALLGDSLLRT